MLWSKFDNEQTEEALKILVEKRKVFFYDGYFFVVNAPKYNGRFASSWKVHKSIYENVKCLPKNVYKEFSRLLGEDLLEYFEPCQISSTFESPCLIGIIHFVILSYDI